MFLQLLWSDLARKKNKVLIRTTLKYNAALIQKAENDETLKSLCDEANAKEDARKERPPHTGKVNRRLFSELAAVM